MDAETLEAILSAFGDSGMVAIILWLLVREQARHDALLRVLVDRERPPRTDYPTE